MRTLILFISMALPPLLFAQKQSPPFSDLEHPIDQKTAQFRLTNIYIGNENQQDNLIRFFRENYPHLSHPSVNLEVSYHKQSLTQTHYCFEQFVKGNKIFRSQLKAAVDKNGYIRSVSDYSFPTDMDFPEEFPPEQVIDQYLSRTDLFVDSIWHEKVYFFHNGVYTPSIRAEIIAPGDIFREVILDEEARPIYIRDMTSYSSKTDTTASGKAFKPDPLTTANETYGPPYVDADNADVPELNAERFPVTLKVMLDTLDTFRLENPYAKLTEHSDPVVPPAVSDTPDFSFTRAQSGFEDVMCIYHLTTYQQYLQSLGFFNLVDYQIHVDAHGHSGQDQSSFISGTNPPRLTFGASIPGSAFQHVNDAEDADVIIHEYGHAIMFSAAPNTNIGHERQALDEGIGDYLAVSYSKHLDEFRWRKVFNWDGHNEFWPGREADTDKTYPDDLTSHPDNTHLTNNIYADAEIWSSALADVLTDIGRETTDQIMLESGFGYSSGMSMADAARLFMQADTLLNGAENSLAIQKRFCQRGFILDCDTVVEEPDTAQFVLLLGSEKFAAGVQPAVVKFYYEEDFHVEMYNSQGHLIFVEQVFETKEFQVLGRHRNSMSGHELTPGVYILRVRTNTDTYVFKLMKFSR